MKYKIAYLDESDQWLNTFYHTFKKDFEIVLIKIDGSLGIDEIITKLFSDNIDAIVSDYLLEEEGNGSFNRNKIVQALKAHRPYFPIIMLTAHESQAINHMDDVHIIYGKHILDGENDYELNLFKAKIKSNIEHYYTKFSSTQKRIEELAKKKNSGGLQLSEEEELTRLLILMDELEPEGKDMPANLLSQGSITKLNEFVAETKALLEELKKQKKN